MVRMARNALPPGHANPLSREAVVLVVLAKSPAPGVSKTRLGASIGEDAAAALAEAFLDDTLGLAACAGVPLRIAYTPLSAGTVFARKAPGAVLESQPEGDLGARISTALESALAVSNSAVLIGTDTPHLPHAILHEAFEALRSASMVLGPARDGGFYLIGLREPGITADLFAAVEWSTASVFETVLANAARLGISVATTPEITDIDDLESLEAALAAARRLGTAPRTLAAAEVPGSETVQRFDRRSGRANKEACSPVLDRFPNATGNEAAV